MTEPAVPNDQGLPSKTSGGCKCGECHWCKWQTDPVEAIKILINGLVERDLRLESVEEEKGHFFAADQYRDSRKGKLEVLGWIERQQEAEKPQKVIASCPNMHDNTTAKPKPVGT